MLQYHTWKISCSTISIDEYGVVKIWTNKSKKSRKNQQDSGTGVGREIKWKSWANLTSPVCFCFLSFLFFSISLGWQPLMPSLQGESRFLDLGFPSLGKKKMGTRGWGWSGEGSGLERNHMTGDQVELGCGGWASKSGGIQGWTGRFPFLPGGTKSFLLWPAAREC